MKLCFFLRIFFAICRLRHVHVRKDTRLSTLFRATSWVGPGNEARCIVDTM